MVQGNLFEDVQVKIEIDVAKNAETGLVITTPQTNTLSKQQQTFNRLVKRIEKLRVNLNQLTKSLDENLVFYGKYIHPLEQKLIDLNKKMIKLLFRFFTTKGALPVTQRRSLGTIISIRLKDMLQIEKCEPDAELKEIYKAVEGISYEEEVEKDFGNLKSDMESFFKDFGFDINIEDIHSQMTKEEMMHKAIEMEEKLRHYAEQKIGISKLRKKTKKQLENEERERQLMEARAKNIGTIYRQLAKVFHPDLEQDEQLKLEKEELMKQLTLAYNNNDLHTLLSLELAWIKKEDNNPGKFTDSKLGIYNEVLKEQVNELEDEIDEIYNHQRYEPLQRFAVFRHMISSINFKIHKHHIEARINEITKAIAILEENEKQSLPALKKMIREFQKIELTLS